jgi:hypothetical protein
MRGLRAALAFECAHEPEPELNMPNVNEMLQSKYLKKEDFPDPVLMTIAGVHKVNIAKEDEKPQYKYAMKFNEAEKPLLLNSTNIKLAAKFCNSDDSDDWVGKKIVVYNDENVSFGNDIIGGIRFRRPKTPANKASSPVADMDDDIPNF